MKKLSWLTVAVTAGILACRADPVVRRNIPYAGVQDPERMLDVYSPAPDQAPAPVAHGALHPFVVWVHGGGWSSGDKADPLDTPAWKARICNEHGLVFVSVNYRLLFGPRKLPGATRPVVNLHQMEQDFAQAIRWVRDHAADFGGDPDCFFVMGHSAGAQLVALLCTDESYLAAEGIPLTAIKGCIPVDGDTYYPELQIDRQLQPHRKLGYELKFPTPDEQRALSSVVHVAPGKGIPPFLLLHVADFPETGTRIQAEILAQKLRDCDVPVKIFYAPGRTHTTLDYNLGRPDDPATQAMLTFLDAEIWHTSYAQWSKSLAGKH